MESLPLEIVSSICSHLDKPDWIQSVHVCQSWRTIIPMAVADLWRHLDVDSKTLAYLPYVHYFPSLRSFWFESAAVGLRALPPGQGRKLEFKATTMTETMEILKPHTEELTSLSIIYNGITLHLFHAILNTCKRLAVFRFKAFAYIDDTVYHNQQDLYELPTLHGDFPLVYLEISYPTAFDFRSILVHCPHLKALKLIDRSYYYRIPLQQVLDFCPRLKRLAYGNLTNHVTDRFDWQSDDAQCHHHGISNSDRGGLEWLLIDSYFMNDPTLPHLAQTVKRLYLPSMNVTFPLGSDRLETFACDSVEDVTKLIKLFQHSPRLTHLDIHTMSRPEALVDPQLLHAFQLLTMLRHVELPALCASDQLAGKFLAPLTDSLISLAFADRIYDGEALHFLEQFKRLEILSLSIGHQVSLTALKKLPLVRHMSLEASDLPTYNKSLVALNQLETLELNVDRLLSYQPLQELVETAPRLRRLTVNNVFPTLVSSNFLGQCREKKIELRGRLIPPSY